MAKVGPTSSLRPTPARRTTYAEQQLRAALIEIKKFGMPLPIKRFLTCSAPVARTLVYIHESYAGPIQVLDMAAKAELSQFHFIRRFKKEMGCTPHRYLLLYRISHAKELLVSRPDLMVKNVGCQVGYNDPAAFSRVFHKHVGMPAKAYREQELRKAAQKRGT